MILANSIRREIFATCALVTVVLAIILLGGRLMIYLGYAAEGRIVPSLVFQLVLYRAPEFMQMILPLGFFMGILLTLGRMSVERELAVIEGAGLGLVWVFRQLVGVSCILMLCVMGLSLYLGPLGVAKTDLTFAEQAQRADFETLAPGRFHPMRSGKGVTYVERLADSGREMEDLFLAEVSDPVRNSDVAGQDEVSVSAGLPSVSVVLAGKGKRQVFSNAAEEFLQLREGKRYELTPGEANLTLIEFEGYRAKIVDRELETRNTRIKGMPTFDLLNDKSLKAHAEFHWRVGLALLIPNVVLLALALCRVNPRQGRFFRLFPAIGLYLLYLGMAMVLKAQIEKHGMSMVPVFWGLHVAVLLIGVFGLMWADGRLRFKRTSLAQNPSMRSA